MHRGDEWHVDVAAGHTYHLLRGRNRNGRQRQPWRSRRSKNSDAVERRLERGLFHCGSGEPVRAFDSQSNLRISGYQCSVTATNATLPLLLDAANDRGSPIGESVRPWIHGVSLSGEPQNSRLRTPLRKRDGAGGKQSFERRTGSGARLAALHGKHLDRDVRQEHLSSGGKTALSAYVGPLPVLLVSAKTSMKIGSDRRKTQ